MTIARQWRVIGRLLNPEAIAKAARIEMSCRAPVRVRLRAWRRGFSTASYLLYDLDKNHASAYLPDATRIPQSRIEGSFGRVLADKVLFNALAGVHTVVPELLAIVARGRLIPARTTASVANTSTLLAYAERNQGVIVKPARGNRGRRVSCIQVHATGPLIDGRTVSEADVDLFLGRLDDYIVTERIIQADYAAQIFPAATNTIRIITMPDPDDGWRPFIPVAAHRFGVSGSVPTDNWARGGLLSHVELATGTLSAAIQDPRISSSRHRRHPETDAQIEGVTIPGWHDITAAILKLARALSFLTFVGWDVAVTDGGPVVIEGNNPPDRAIQMLHPFLEDPKTRRFFVAMLERRG